MNYSKLPLTVEEQIAKLKARGLIFINENEAKQFLSNVSYYRLRAYTYPFQDNTSNTHSFNVPITFEEIVKLYQFDSELRSLIFKSIETIEISFRTQIIYNYALDYGSHWYLNENLFSDNMQFLKMTKEIQNQNINSKEEFIKHYISKYSYPHEPASWMAFEVISFGLLSKIFSNLKNNKTKDKIKEYYELKDVDIIVNWMMCLNLLRNFCAHHSRIWNRRYQKIVIPKKTNQLYVANKNIQNNKLYSYLINIQYLLNTINSQNTFSNELKLLVELNHIFKESDLGFTLNWRTDKFWSN